MHPTALQPVDIKVYHVFLASPGDVQSEREEIRGFFSRFNRNQGSQWGVRFDVVDWENYATVGVGRPQGLISEQTLERYRDSLALVIGVMAQRFGSPTGAAESGTEEEFNWALESYLSRGFPEIKWFFREIHEFRAPQDPKAIRDALDQWEKVREFQDRLRRNEPPLFFCSYRGADEFGRVLAGDLERWLFAPERPWVQCQPPADQSPAALKPPRIYLETLRQDFWRLDIAGIDNDRAFDIPLSEVYVRLRVIFDSEDAGGAAAREDDGTIDIRTALPRYSKLAIVGDPGSGKSTFLKFIALTLAQAELENDDGIAIERLALTGALPIPIFLSCWDLADCLRKVDSHGTLDVLLSFIERRLQAYQFDTARSDLESLLASGGACILFDGLDEVPTDQGRAAVSRLVEQLVARYRKNRYVVTSRVRAYTGDTILKGGFTRCDIQPFDADDRATFVRNWMALLFHIAPGQVPDPGSEAAVEYQRLTTSIERSDRIRLLAVNPLLLTVIAIVHWNRKRLPEQRVDLYDECVDVLLGQRKDAEHIRVARLSAALDESLEDERHEDRAWTRKRFGEIALHIQLLAGTSDDAGKAELVRLLTPRFQDRYVFGEAQAQLRAERFLERHELRSGLLVSHRAKNYRFVHLTFQEYLAAWTLSNMELAEVADRVGRRLREAKWFETLQLLGGTWAKESDEKLDRYLDWLLEQQGTRIAERAPVVALCANISRDVIDIASMKPETRRKLYESLKDTLHAFNRASGVPAQIQVEILEALGTLGAAVKANLIEATRASLYQVRARAIEMLLPHLSEDELFDMTWILQDRSREPVAAYVLALLSRSEHRAVALFGSTRYRTRQFFYAFSWILSRLGDRFYWARQKMRPLVEMIATEGGGEEAEHWYRSKAIRALMEYWRDAETRSLLLRLATESPIEDVRSGAIKALALGWRDDSVLEILGRLICEDPLPIVRASALEALGSYFPGPARASLMKSSIEDESADVRRTALEALGRYRDKHFLIHHLEWRATEDPAEDVRAYAASRVELIKLCMERKESGSGNE